MQVYTANGLNASRGKGGASYHPRQAVCLETVKSKGDPATGRLIAMGILSGPTGVYRLAANQRRWPMALPPPLRLK